MASRYTNKLKRDQTPPSVNAVKKDGSDAGRRSWMVSGMKASHFSDQSTVRSGVFSAMDSKRRFENERKINNTSASMLLSAVDANTGAPMPNATMTMGGKILRANGAGHFRLIDKSVLLEQKRLREEMDATIDESLELALASDASCMDILGLTESAYDLYLEANPKASVKDRTEIFGYIPDDIWRYEARVRFLQLYPQGSKELLQGIAKLRALIMGVQPYLDSSNITEEALKKAEDPDA